MEWKNRRREGGKGRRAYVTWYGLAAGVPVADPGLAPAIPPPGKAAVISPTPCLAIASSFSLSLLSLSLSLEFASPFGLVVPSHLLPPLRLSLSRRSLISLLACFVLSDHPP
jgi:hypothetical protein